MVMFQVPLSLENITQKICVIVGRYKGKRVERWVEKKGEKAQNIDERR